MSTRSGTLRVSEHPSSSKIEVNLRNSPLVANELTRTGLEPCGVFNRFIDSNPSFSKENTARTYLTQTTQYLRDWLFDFAELPVRFQPLIERAQELDAFREADLGLTAEERTPLRIAQLEQELRKQFPGNQNGSHPIKSSEETLLSVRGAHLARGPIIHETGIARADQAIVGSLLNDYEGLLDSDFWERAFSNQSIGRVMRHYEDSGISATTRCLRMTAVHHFKAFIGEETGAIFNERSLKQPRREEKVEIVHNVHELEQVSSYLRARARFEGDYAALRDELLFELLYFTGGRATAISQLNVKDIQLNRGEITLREKGKKERKMPLLPETVEKFKKFLIARDEHHREKAPIYRKGRLFHSRLGNPIDRIKLYSILRQIGEKAELELPLSPHSIRRSMACALYDRGAPLHGIQQLLGHASPKTTIRYLAHGSRTEAETLLLYHPMSPEPSHALRAESLRNQPLEVPVNVERTTEEVPALRIAGAFEKLGRPPGFLRSLEEASGDSATLLDRFTSIAPENSDATKSQYKSSARRFLVDRFHELELPTKYQPLQSTIVSYYLTDRLDWMVRTGELSVEVAERLSETVSSIKGSKSLTEELRALRGNKDGRTLASGVKFSKCGDGYRLSLPPVIRLEPGSRILGAREKSFLQGIFRENETLMDQGFWEEVFNSEEVGKVLERQLAGGAKRITIHKEKAALRMFGEFLQSDALKISKEDGSSLVHFRSTTAPKARPQKFLTESEITAIATHLDESVRSASTEKLKLQALHDRAAFAVLYGTAARVGAVSQVKLEDLSLGRSEVYLREKREREVTLPLLPAVQDAITEYLQVRGSLTKSGAIPARARKDLLFFADKKGEPDRKSFERMLNRVSKAAGVVVSLRGNTNLSPQTIRRSAAVHLGNRGASLYDLQELLGHKDLETTSIYVNQGSVEMRDFLDRFQPTLKTMIERN